MFIGHFGVGFGTKAAAPRTSLGVLFLAAQFIDLLWPTFLLVGLEHVEIAPGASAVTPLRFTDYPYSHSLLFVVLWGVLFAGVTSLCRRDLIGAFVCGVAVVSHWILDLFVHIPDLPLAPGGSVRVGMGLWSSLSATLALELAVFTVGIVIYLRTTRAANRKGVYGFWGLVAFLLAIYFANVFGQPPPNVRAIAIVGHAQWLIVLWAFWIDRNRVNREPAQAMRVDASRC